MRRLDRALIQPPCGAGPLLPRHLSSEGIPLRSDQIRSLDWRMRKARRIGNLPADVLQETVGKILGLVDPDGLANCSLPTTSGCSSLTGRRGTMHSPWRTLTLGVVLALGVVLGADIANLSAQARDPRMGTWKLDVAKSKVRPGPSPQGLTLKVEP